MPQAIGQQPPQQVQRRGRAYAVAVARPLRSERLEHHRRDLLRRDARPFGFQSQLLSLRVLRCVRKVEVLVIACMSLCVRLVEGDCSQGQLLGLRVQEKGCAWAECSMMLAWV